MTDLPFKEWLQ